MLNSLRDVLNESIQDLYSAETQLLKALPRMAKAASEPQLKEAFTAHLEETRNQADRKSTRLNSSHSTLSRMPSSA